MTSPPTSETTIIKVRDVASEETGTIPVAPDEFLSDDVKDIVLGIHKARQERYVHDLKDRMDTILNRVEWSLKKIQEYDDQNIDSDEELAEVDKKENDRIIDRLLCCHEERYDVLEELIRMGDRQLRIVGFGKSMDDPLLSFDTGPYTKFKIRLEVLFILASNIMEYARSMKTTLLKRIPKITVIDENSLLKDTSLMTQAFQNVRQSFKYLLPNTKRKKASVVESGETQLKHIENAIQKWMNDFVTLRLQIYKLEKEIDETRRLELLGQVQQQKLKDTLNFKNAELDAVRVKLVDTSREKELLKKRLENLDTELVTTGSDANADHDIQSHKSGRGWTERSYPVFRSPSGDTPRTPDIRRSEVDDITQAVHKLGRHTKASTAVEPTARMDSNILAFMKRSSQPLFDFFSKLAEGQPMDYSGNWTEDILAEMLRTSVKHLRAELLVNTFRSMPKHDLFRIMAGLPQDMRESYMQKHYAVKDTDIGKRSSKKEGSKTSPVKKPSAHRLHSTEFITDKSQRHSALPLPTLPPSFAQEYNVVCEEILFLLAQLSHTRDAMRDMLKGEKKLNVSDFLAQLPVLVLPEDTVQDPEKVTKQLRNCTKYVKTIQTVVAATLDHMRKKIEKIEARQKGQNQYEILKKKANALTDLTQQYRCQIAEYESHTEQLLGTISELRDLGLHLGSQNSSLRTQLKDAIISKNQYIRLRPKAPSSSSWATDRQRRPKSALQMGSPSKQRGQTERTKVLPRSSSFSAFVGPLLDQDNRPEFRMVAKAEFDSADLTTPARRQSVLVTLQTDLRGQSQGMADNLDSGRQLFQEQRLSLGLNHDRPVSVPLIGRTANTVKDPGQDTSMVILESDLSVSDLLHIQKQEQEHTALDFSNENGLKFELNRQERIFNMDIIENAFQNKNITEPQRKELIHYLHSISIIRQKQFASLVEEYRAHRAMMEIINQVKVIKSRGNPDEKHRLEGLYKLVLTRWDEVKSKKTSFLLFDIQEQEFLTKFTKRCKELMQKKTIPFNLPRKVFPKEDQRHLARELFQHQREFAAESLKNVSLPLQPEVTSLPRLLAAPDTRPKVYYRSEAVNVKAQPTVPYTLSWDINQELINASRKFTKAEINKDQNDCIDTSDNIDGFTKSSSEEN